jgi:hypothetical protein
LEGHDQLCLDHARSQGASIDQERVNSRSAAGVPIGGQRLDALNASEGKPIAPSSDGPQVVHTIRMTML